MKRSSKGATKRAPNTFEPAVWGARIDGRLFLILVCAASQRSIGGKPDGRGGVTADAVYHPVAIRLGSPAQILYGFSDNSHEWLVKTADEFKLPRIYAQRALAEAWRGVEEIRNDSFPGKTWNFHCKVNMIRSLDDCEHDQERTMFRNVNAWLRWDDWNKLNLKSAQRAACMAEIGIPTTAKKLDKMVENAGLAEC